MPQIMRVSSEVGPDQQHIVSFQREQIDAPPSRRRGTVQPIIKAVGGATAKKKPSGGSPRGSLAARALPPTGTPKARR